MAARRTTPIDVDRLGVEGARAGWVHLLGAGPGDPGLLTVRAAAILQTADLVAYDRLAPRELLELSPPHAEQVCVGKTASRPGWRQTDTNGLLVERARAGLAVARLKGGDPFVFGRGGEEALACRAAGVPVEVVSGVSSAVAAPAAAGIPVTHRGIATGVAFVTGHEDPTKPDAQVDFDALARFHGTLVFLMGVANAGRIAALLIAGGRSATEPVAVVRWGTTDAQQVVTSDLAGLADDMRRHDIGSPATIVVGEVVDLRPLIADLAAAHVQTDEQTPEPSGDLDPRTPGPVRIPA